MVDIDIHNNVRHFSLFVCYGILKWREMALELSDNDQQDESIKIYTDLISILENQDSLYTDRGIALYDEGDTDQAINDFQKALTINPDNTLARDMLVDALKYAKIDDLENNYLTLIEIVEKGIDEKEIQGRIDDGKLQGIAYEGIMFYNRQDVANCI